MTTGLHLLSTQNLPQEALYGKSDSQYGPMAMMNELEIIKEERNKLERVKNDLRQQNIQSFKELRFSFSVETIMKTLDFGKLSEKQEKQILEFLKSAVKKKKFSLTRITINHSKHLSNLILLSLLRNSPKLTVLKLVDCQNITYKAFARLKQTCPCLSRLHIESISELTMIGVKNLHSRGKFKFLKEVCLINLPALTEFNYNHHGIVIKLENCPEPRFAYNKG